MSGDFSGICYGVWVLSALYDGREPRWTHKKSMFCFFAVINVREDGLCDIVLL